MQVRANGHVRRSAAEWRGIIERYRQSGMGIREFCAQEGVTEHRFEQWYRRHRRAEHRMGQFVEVKPLSAIAGPWAVEVELPSGVRLRLRG
jgi:hypothetical protein